MERRLVVSQGTSTGVSLCRLSFNPHEAPQHTLAEGELRAIGSTSILECWFRFASLPVPCSTLLPPTLFPEFGVHQGLQRIAVAWGGAHFARRPKTHVEDTWGRRLRLSGTACEDTWASADTYQLKTVQTNRRQKNQNTHSW